MRWKEENTERIIMAASSDVEEELVEPHEIEITPAMERLRDCVKDGECVLFLGSGVHAPPPKDSSYEYPEKQRPPNGKALAEILAESCDFRKELPDESPSDLMRVSLFIETTPGLGRPDLIRSLTDHLRGEEGNEKKPEKKPSPALKMLAKLPFRILVTTNYDLLLEDALTDGKKNPYCILYNPKSTEPTEIIEKEPTAQKPIIFKMHGDINQAKSIVITDEDYIHFVHRMSDKDKYHPFPRSILDKMMLWPILFIGYSLRDYNLRLLLQTLRWQLDTRIFPVSFALNPKPDLLIKRVWQDMRQYVAFLVEDLWTFVPWLYGEVKEEEHKDA
jgi:hypothetical protein